MFWSWATGCGSERMLHRVLHHKTDCSVRNRWLQDFGKYPERWTASSGFPPMIHKIQQPLKQLPCSASVFILFFSWLFIKLALSMGRCITEQCAKHVLALVCVRCMHGFSCLYVLFSGYLLVASYFYMNGLFLFFSYVLLTFFNLCKAPGKVT